MMFLIGFAAGLFVGGCLLVLAMAAFVRGFKERVMERARRDAVEAILRKELAAAAADEVTLVYQQRCVVCGDTRVEHLGFDHPCEFVEAE